MVEVEQKYPVADFGPLEQKLHVLGAKEDASRDEEDQYFNAPDRDFATTDEALRVRRIADANFVTYKGPKRDSQTKTRTEIEVGLANGAQAAADFGMLLTHLGYRAVAFVPKHRRVFHLEREGFGMEITLDNVAGVGRFAELEIQADENTLPAARDVLLRAAEELGLQGAERRSYLELLLAARGGSTSRKRQS
jgi:adenylate cyclase class 2